MNTNMNPQFAGINEGQLLQLRFAPAEINILKQMIYQGMKITSANLQLSGLDFERAQRIKYMYDVVSGRVVIQTKDDLAKHFKKIAGQHGKLGIQDLAVSTVNDVPKWAVVAGIKESMLDARKYGKNIYTVLNSQTLPPDKKLYVVEKAGQKVLVRFKGNLAIPHKYPMEIPGVLEVKGRDQATGDIMLLFDKKYCKLCNRFIIVASLRVPEFHLGMIEIICGEGSKVYVYARTLGPRDTVGYSGGNARIYDYGCIKSEIQPKLKAIASEVYNHVRGNYATTVMPTSDFELIPKEEPKVDIVE